MAILFVFRGSLVRAFVHLYLLRHHFDAIWRFFDEELVGKDS
jgi:hypothetical protein